MLQIRPIGNVLVKTSGLLAVIGFVMMPVFAAAEVQSNVRPGVVTHYNFNSDTGVRLDNDGMPADVRYLSKSIDDSVNAEIEARLQEQRASSGPQLRMQGSMNAGRNAEAERQRGLLRSDDMELSTGGNLQGYLDSRSTVMPPR